MPRSPFAAIAALLMAAAPAAADTIAWNNAGGGAWFTASNWNPPAVPDSTDDVVIALAGTYTISIVDTAHVRSIRMSAASGTQTLSGSAIVVAESLVVLAGASTAINSSPVAGAHLRVAPGGTLRLTGVGGTIPVFNDGTLIVQGYVTLGGAFANGPGATFRVLGGIGGTHATVATGFTNQGLIELTSSGCACATSLSVTSGTLVNAPGATISVLAGAGGDRDLYATLDNQGTLDIGIFTEIRRAGSDHLNSGAINVTGGNLTFLQENPTPTLTNTGAIHIAAGRAFTVSLGAFSHDAGSITGAGTLAFTNTLVATLTAPLTTAALSVSSATLNLNQDLATANTALGVSGATINGPGTLTNSPGVTLSASGAVFNGPLVNRGTLSLSGNCDINGSFFNDSTGTLRSIGPIGGGTLDVASSFDNYGLIEITSSGCACNSILNVTGTLRNRPGANVNVLAGAGGVRQINAGIHNEGTITFGAATSVSRAGADHLNSGTIHVAGGSLTLQQSGATPSFASTGTINVSAGRTLIVNAGTFDMTGGSVTGAGAALFQSTAVGTLTAGFTLATLVVNSATLNLGFDLSTAAIALSGSVATLNGPGTITNAGGVTLSAGSCTFNAALVNHGTVLLSGTSATGPLTTHPGSLIRITSGIGGASHTFQQGFVNHGTIEVTSSGGAFNNVVTQAAGTVLTNAPGGGVNVLAGSGGTRNLNAVFDNQGTMTFGAATSIVRASADHLNSGTFNVTGGNVSFFQSGVTPSFVNRGVVNVAAGRTLSFSSGAFVNDTTGVMAGSGVFGLSAATVVNDGTIAPGASPGLLQVSGPCPMNPTSVFAVEIGGAAAGTQHDRLYVTGAATLSGTMNVTLVGGFEPQPGQVFRVLRAASRAGQFDVVNGLALPNGLAMEPQYSDTGVALRVVSAKWVRELPVGAVPAGRDGHTASWDAGTSRMVVFGGRTDASVSNETWVYQRATAPGESPAWTPLSVAGEAPAPRLHHVAGYHAATNKLIVFGGHDGGPTSWGDVACLSFANGLGGEPAWEAVVVAGGPGPLRGAAGAYDEVNDRLIVFGGSATGACGDASSEVWALSGVAGGAPAWTQVAAGGAPPSARAYAHAAYDPAANRLVVFGGAAPCGAANVDAWALSNANGLGGAASWTPLAAGGVALDSVVLRAAAYDVAGDRVTAFGGLRDDGGVSDQLVSLVGVAGGAPSWVDHPLVGAGPSARAGASAVMAGSRLVMFGGETAAGRTSEVWTLLVDEPAIVDVLGEEPAVPMARELGFARPPWPNPSSGTVTFAIAVPRAQRIELAVHDVAGRRVRVLHAGVIAAGVHGFRWDGRDHEGTRTAAGVYFVALRGEGRSTASRILRLPGSF